MRRSLYEIETLLRKAAIGAGLPVGLAQDMAGAGRWLAGCGVDGLAACLRAITGYDGVPEMQETAAGKIAFANAALAGAGPSAIDFLLSEGKNLAVRLDDMDAPLLMIGLAGAAAAGNGLDIEMAFSDGPQLTVSPQGISGDRPPKWPGSVVLRIRGASSGATVEGAATGGLDVDETAYQALSVLAAQTMVPESRESLLSGAGAGLTDND